MSKSEIGTVVGNATIVNYFEENSSYLLNFTVGGTQKAYLASRYIIDYSFFKDRGDGVYRYTGPGVIDAEKRNTSYFPKDDLLCWAGAISNILEFSGWGDVAGYSNEDDLYDYLKNCFAANNNESEGATVIEMGEVFDWFIQGASYDPLGDAPGYYAGLPGIADAAKVEITVCQGVDWVSTVKAALEEGRAVGLNVFTGGNGHAVTLFGFTYDERYAPSDPRYLTGIIISDSDDSKDQLNSRASQNTLRILPLAYDSEKEAYYAADDDFMPTTIYTIGFRPLDMAGDTEKSSGSFVSIKEGELSYGLQIGGGAETRLQIVGSGAYARDTKVGYNGIQRVIGEAVDTIVSGSGAVTAIQDIWSGGAAYGGEIRAGGEQYVSGGGVAYGTLIGKGGSQIVYSGATASAIIVGSGGLQQVGYEGSIVRETVVEAGGTQMLTDGAGAFGTEIEVSGFQFIENGANGVNNKVRGTQTVSGGSASDTVVYAGASQILDGGLVFRTDVYGTQIISGGTATLTTVRDGGRSYVSGGLFVDGDIYSGGLNIVSGGTADGTTIRSYGLQLITGEGASAENTSIRTRGFQFVQEGATASNGTINGYGCLSVGSGAQAQDYALAPYGSATVESGASVTGFTLGAGAMLDVAGGGSATDLTLAEGARLNVTFGGEEDGTVANGTNAKGAFSVENGSASNLLLARNAAAHMLDGAISSDTTIEDGATLFVEGDTELSGTTELGGRLEVTGYAEADAIVIDLKGKNPSALPFISDSARVSFNTLTVSVADVAGNGLYKLAGNANEFVCTVTVQEAGDSREMEVDDTWIGTDGCYELRLSGGGDLVLEVSMFSGDLTAPVVTINTEETTSSEVVLSVEYDPQSVLRQYSFDGGEWYGYLGDIIVTENGTYYFRSIDAEDNCAMTRYEVTNFDPDALELPVITASSTGPTVGYVTLWAEFDPNATDNYYSFDGNNWQEYDDGVIVNKNGDVFFRSENETYTVTQSYTVDNIVSYINETRTIATPQPGNFTTGIPSRKEQAYSYVVTTTPGQRVQNRDVYMFTSTDHEEDGGRFVSTTGSTYALSFADDAQLTIGGNPNTQLPNIYTRRTDIAGGTANFHAYGVIFNGDTNYLAFSEATGGVTSQDYTDQAIWLLCEGSDATVISTDKATSTLYVRGNLAGLLQGVGEVSFHFEEDLVPIGEWTEDAEGEPVFKLGNFRLPENLQSVCNRALGEGIVCEGSLTVGNDFTGRIEAVGCVDKSVSLAMTAKWNTDTQQNHQIIGAVGGTAGIIGATGISVGDTLLLTFGDFAGSVTADASGSRFVFSTIEYEDQPEPDDDEGEGEGGGSSSEAQDDTTVRSGTISDLHFQAKGVVTERTTTSSDGSSEVTTGGGAIDVAWFSGDVSAVVENVVLSLDMTYNTSVSYSISIGGNSFSAVAVKASSMNIDHNFTGSLTATVRDITQEMIWDPTRTKADGSPVRPSASFGGSTFEATGLYIEDSLTVGGKFGGSIDVNGGELQYLASGEHSKAAIGCAYFGMRATSIDVKGALDTDISFSCYDASFTDLLTAASFRGVQARSLSAADFSGSVTFDVVSGNDTLKVVGLDVVELSNGNDGIFDITGTIDTGRIADAVGVNTEVMNIRVSGTVSSVGTALNHSLDAMSIDTRADYVAVAAGGAVYGDIWFSDSTYTEHQGSSSSTPVITRANKIVIDSNATVVGNLNTTLGSIDLVFDLNDHAMLGTERTEGVALTVGNSLVLTTTSITINLNDATEGKTYALIQDDNMDRWLGQVITVNYQGELADLVIGDTATGFGFTVSADVVDAQLVVTVDELSDLGAPDAPTSLKVNSINSEGTAKLSWATASRGSSVTTMLEYRINGKGSVEVETTASEYQIFGLEAGDLVEWRVREESDGGAVTGEWSDTEVFTVGRGSSIVSGVRQLKCTKVSGSIAKLDWRDVYCSEGLGYYEVRYCQTAGTPTWKKGTYVSKTVTANELLISNLGSSETVYCEVRAVDKYGNAGEWTKVETGGDTKHDETPMEFPWGENLQAESVSLGNNSCVVDFSWGFARETGTIQSGFESYVVCFQKQNTSGPASVYSITIEDQYTTTATYRTADDDLAAGTYDWWVEAYDQAGNVTKTANSSFTVDFDAPAGEFKSMGAVWYTIDHGVLEGGDDEEGGGSSQGTAETISSITVDFSWDAEFTDDSGVRYRVDVSGDKYFSLNKTYSFYTTDTSLTLNDSNEYSAGALLGKDTVYWRVTAVDACLNESFASSVQSFTFYDDDVAGPVVETTTPRGPYSCWSEQRGDLMHFEWDEASDVFGVKYYRLTLKKKSGGTEVIQVDGSKNSYDYRNLADGTYSVSVTAVNYAGLSSESVSAGSFAMDTVAPELANTIKAKALGSDVSISWDKATDNIAVAGYRLSIKKVKTTTSQGKTVWKELSSQTVDLDAKTTDYWMYGAADGSYIFSVCAYDDSNNVSASSSTEIPLTIDSSLAPGNSFSTAMKVSSGESYGGSVGGTNKADYFVIDSSYFRNPGELEITVDEVVPANGGKSGSVRFTLYNENQKKIATKTVSKGGTYTLEQLIDGSNAKCGDTFYFTAESSKGNSYMGYGVTFTTTEFPDPTPNNSIATASVIAAPAESVTVSSWVGYGDASDYYSLTLTPASGAGQATFTLDGLKDKATLGIYNASGKKIKNFSVAAGKSQSYTLFLPEEQTCYVSVTSGDNGKGKQNTVYDLTASVDYNEEVEFLGDVGIAAGSLDGTVTKYYTVDPGAGLADITLSGMSQSVTATLYDRTGKKLKSYSSKTAKVVASDYLMTEGCYLAVTAKKATDYQVKFDMEYAETITTVGGTGIAAGVITVSDPMDMYEFAGGGLCSLSLSGMTESVTLTLYSSAGKQLKSFSTKTAKTGIVDYMAGDDTYYVTVSGKKATNYQLTLDKVGETTVDLADGTRRLSGSLAAGSSECYRLLTDGSGKLSLSLAGIGGSVSVSLYDSAGKKVKGLSSSDANGKLVLSAYNLRDTKYDLVVTSKTACDYSALLAPSEPAKANTFAGARVLSEGELVDEWVGANDPVDLFAFTVEKTSKLTVDLDFFSELHSVGTTAAVHLFKASGAEISLNDALSANVLAGTYFIEVEALNTKKNRDIGYAIAVELS